MRKMCSECAITDAGERSLPTSDSKTSPCELPYMALPEQWLHLIIERNWRSWLQLWYTGRYTSKREQVNALFIYTRGLFPEDSSTLALEGPWLGMPSYEFLQQKLCRIRIHHFELRQKRIVKYINNAMVTKRIKKCCSATSETATIDVQTYFLQSYFGFRPSFAHAWLKGVPSFTSTFLPW